MSASNRERSLASAKEVRAKMAAASSSSGTGSRQPAHKRSRASRASTSARALQDFNANSTEMLKTLQTFVNNTPKQKPTHADNLRECFIKLRDFCEANDFSSVDKTSVMEYLLSHKPIHVDRFLACPLEIMESFLNKVLARIRYENKHPLKFGPGEIEIDDMGDEKGNDEWE